MPLQVTCGSAIRIQQFSFLFSHSAQLHNSYSASLSMQPNATHATQHNWSNSCNSNNLTKFTHHNEIYLISFTCACPARTTHIPRRPWNIDTGGLDNLWAGDWKRERDQLFRCAGDNQFSFQRQLIELLDIKSRSRKDDISLRIYLNQGDHLDSDPKCPG